MGIKVDFAITGYRLSRDLRGELECSLGVALVYFHLTDLRDTEARNPNAYANSG